MFWIISYILQSITSLWKIVADLHYFLCLHVPRVKGFLASSCQKDVSSSIYGT